MAKKNKIIQVPMPEELVYALDALSGQQERSRSALIRDAAAQYIANAEGAELDRRYVAAYKEHPENEDDVAWSEMSAQELAKRLAEDKW